MAGQLVVPAGGGLDYDWSKDHVFVKAPMALSDGRVTVVEDVLKPGFYLAPHHHRLMVEIFYILAGEITFTFDDETIVATIGTTVSVPANTRHEVSCPAGGRLITVFTPGGFDQYLAELAGLTTEQLADEPAMNALAERYDIWPS
jgi:quercetin dioxygenase-like cupin family protein